MLSILNTGISGQFGNTYTVAWDEIPELVPGSDIDNEYLALFSSIDMADVIVLVFSLLGLLLSFGTICGEKREGTLKAVFASEVSRAAVLLGKCLGGIAVLLTSLIIGFLSGFIVLLVMEGGILGGEEWLRIGLFISLSLIYAVIFYLIGTVISAITYHPATSLAFSLFFWVVLVIVWPRSAQYIGQQLVPVSTKESWDGKIRAEYSRKFSAAQEFDNQNKEWRQSGKSKMTTYFQGTGIMVHEPDKTMIEYFLKRTEELDPIIIEVADRVWSIQNQKHQHFNRQRKLIAVLSGISPVYPYDTASAILSRTDVGSFERFMNRLQTYRGQILQWMKERNVTGSPRWFVQDSELDLSGFPVFTQYSETFSETIRRMLFPLSLMILVSLVLLLASFAAFLHYDIR